MLLDLKFSISTLSITAGTFVAALYGMNLKNFIEENDFGFYGISAWCTLFGFIVAGYGLTKLRKVQRVSMYGHGPGALVSREPPKVKSWGSGAWGGGSRNGVSRGDFGPMGPLHGATDFSGLGKRGEPLEVMQRERALARKLVKVDTKTDVTKGR